MDNAEPGTATAPAEQKTETPPAGETRRAVWATDAPPPPPAGQAKAPKPKPAKKPAAKKAAKKPRGTGDLPLKGGKDAAKQKGLDGSTLKEKPEPKVLKAARKYAEELEKIEDGKDDANLAAAALETALKETKKKPEVRIVTERRVYTFHIERLSKLRTKKQDAVK